MKKTVLSLVLALALLAGCFACAEGAEDPVAVRVGNYTYSKSLVEFTMRSAADAANTLWDALTAEEKEKIRDAAIRDIIGIGIIENKLTEWGRHDFTENEEELLRANAQTSYDQMWTSLYRYMEENDVEVSKEEVTAWLDEMGYTLDMYFENAKAAERQFRMFEIYCADVELSAEEIDTYYLEEYVNPDRERYENDISLFEQEMVSKNNEAFFVPEGYIRLKWILLSYPETLWKEAEPQLFRVYLANAETEAAYNELAEKAATAEDWNELDSYRDLYDRNKAESEEAAAALIEKLSEALPAAEAAKALIREALDSGVSFEQLVNKYSSNTDFADPENPGTMFHPDSPNWSERTREAILQLKQPGDLSDPVVMSEGIYLFYYAGDVPAGVHELTEEERRALEQTALYKAKLNHLTELLEGWEEEYEINVDLSVLSMD